MTYNRPKRVYIAGPMTGIEGYNYPSFHLAAMRLNEVGYEAVSPAQPEMLNLSYTECLQKSIDMLMTCDMVALLPGWWNSNGANEEYRIAKSLHIPAYSLDYVISLTYLRPQLAE